MRKCIFVVLSLLCACALFAPPAGAADHKVAAPAVAARPAGCPPPFRGPPVYPRQAQRDGVGGVATVIVDTDACGRVLRATLENSSLNPALDAEALAVTKQWVLPDAVVSNPPQADGSYRVRVPVEFKPTWHARRSEHVTDDGCRELRVSGKIPPPVDAEGAVIERVKLDDPCPIGYERVAQAAQYARANAWFTASMPGDMPLEEYRVDDGDGYSIWTLLKDAQGVYRVALRSRVVSDGSFWYFAQNRLCELPEAQCQQMFERLNRLWGNKSRVPVMPETVREPATQPAPEAAP